MTKVIAVACVDTNYGLGKDGRLLYKSTTDMAFFVGVTQGKLVVGGRKTMEGIKSLPNRGMVCLTRDPSSIEDIAKYMMVTNSDGLTDIKELAEYLETDVVVIGGGQIYAKMSDHVDELYLTVLKIHPDDVMESDTVFPIDCYNHLDKSEIIFDNDEMTIYHSYRE